jgi:hypothetical protein
VRARSSRGAAGITVLDLNVVQASVRSIRGTSHEEGQLIKAVREKFYDFHEALRLKEQPRKSLTT